MKTPYSIIKKKIFSFLFISLTIFALSSCEETVKTDEEVLSNISLSYDKDQVLVIGKEISTSVAHIKGIDECGFAIKSENYKFLKIDNEGKISFKKLGMDKVKTGKIKVDISIITKNGHKNFKDAITISIESSPVKITYENTKVTAFVGKKKVVKIKEFIGTKPITFIEIVKGNPNFMIDEAGDIILKENNTIEPGDYKITIRIGNSHDTITFKNVIIFTVVDAKPSALKYGNMDVLSGTAFSLEKPTIVSGFTVEYTLEGNAINSEISIDKVTGVISSTNGISNKGSYPITVTATNEKGARSFEFTLSVVSKTVKVFLEGGWQKNTATEGEHSLGNFIQFDEDGKGVQATNKKWNFSWGFWTINGVKAVSMIAKKIRSADWLISKNEIDFTKIYFPKLNINISADGGANYKFIVLFSEDYDGTMSPNSATWTKIAQFAKPIVDGDIKMKVGKTGQAYDFSANIVKGKKGYIAYKLVTLEGSSYKSIYLFSTSITGNEL